MKHHRNLRVAVYQRQGEEEDEARQRVVARCGGLRRKSGHDYISTTRLHIAGNIEILINYKQMRFHCPPILVLKNLEWNGIYFR